MGTRSPLASVRFSLLVAAALLSSCGSLAHRRSSGELSRSVVAASAPAPSLSTSRTTRSDDDEEDRPVFGDMRWPGKDAPAPLDTFNAQGLYLGFGLTHGEILGELDGSTAVVDDVMTPTEFVFLPDIEASQGFSANLAHRWEVWELQLGYGSTDYDASFGGVQMDTKIKTIDLNIKHHYRVDTSMQPYVLLGLGWAKGRINDGAQDMSGIYDAKLKDGINVNVGGGVSLFVTPTIALFGQAVYRFGRYDSVDGTFGTTLVSGTIDADSYEVTLGASFRIGRERH